VSAINNLVSTSNSKLVMPRWQPILVLALGLVLTLPTCATRPQEVAAKAGVLVDTTGAALSASLLQWANGTYTNCTSYTNGTAWSVQIASGVGSMDHNPLSVVQDNTSCTLTLTSLVTSENSKTTYAAASPIQLGASYGTASAFANGANPIAFYANAVLSSTSFSSAFTVTILYSSNPNLGTGTLGASGVCPTGEASKADSSGNGAANLCCAAAANYLNCNGSCVNDQTDNNNCGVCGTVCNTWQGQFCSSGQCVACGESSNDLSGIGTGDFSISFNLTDTHGTGTERAIINQRNVCGFANFWDLRMSSSGYLFIETDDGTNDRELTPSVLIENNGSHSIVVNRTSQILFALIDGSPVAWGSSLANWSGNLPALSYTDVCDSTNTVTSVTNLCINPGAPPPLQNGTYAFLNPNLAYALDDEGSSGTLADQVTYTGANQNWTVTQVEGGTKYKITAANNLALTGSSSGGQLTLASWAAASDQLWTFIPNSIQSGTGDTIYNIINASTGQAIDANGGGQSHQVIQYAWTTTNTNQAWLLIDVPIQNGTYEFINPNLGYALDDEGSSGTLADQVLYTGTTSNQNWTVTQVAGGIEILAANGLALTAPSSNSQQVLLAAWTAASNQLWTFSPVSIQSGTNAVVYNIVNVSTGYAIDANGGGQSHEVIQYTSSTTNANQAWLLINRATLTPPILNGTYSFADAAGYSLDDPGASGTAIPDQVTYSGTDQQWIVTLVSGLEYKIISANISAGALTAGSSEGTIASLSSYSDLPSQLWVIQQNGSSGYNVVNVGGGLVLDDNNGGSSTQCHQWAWSTTNANQNWTLTAR
jgi:hypothetical protein